MAYYAILDDNDIVVEVVSAEEDIVNSGFFGSIDKVLKTSYNTHGGQHLLGGTPLRKNYAAPGFTYNREIDGFVPPRLYASWILNNETGLWNPPVDYPDSRDFYVWNEEMQRWDQAPTTFEEPVLPSY